MEPIPDIPTEPLFSSITGKYDLLNRVLSLGMDRSWRKKLLSELPEKGVILDVACGTGDVALEIGRRQVVGLDPSLPMLIRAKQKGLKLVVCAQGEALPFRERSFSYATVAFGIRNFSDPDMHLEEMLRTLKEGGYGILEFSLPTNPLWRLLFNIYRMFIPFIGALIARSRPAYGHLSSSIAEFSRVDLSGAGIRAGFQRAESKKIMGGIVTITRLWNC